jgi:hypothetical protein
MITYTNYNAQQQTEQDDVHMGLVVLSQHVTRIKGSSLNLKEVKIGLVVI